MNVHGAMDCTDTRVGTSDSDTMILGVSAGLRVQVCAGQLRGLLGTIVDRRPNGQVLVRLQRGAYAELPRIFLQLV